jgi:hypothetical protein
MPLRGTRRRMKLIGAGIGFDPDCDSDPDPDRDSWWV